MNEDKDLLFKYLCMALPYDIIVDYEGSIYILNEIDPACKDIDYITVRIQDVERLVCAKNVMIENIKPYLRPMSSMTEEEEYEYEVLTDCCDYTYFNESDKVIDWLLKNYFDFMGLIPKSLAIEVNENNNPYKD